MIENKGGMIVCVDDLESSIEAVRLELDPEKRREQSRFNRDKVKLNYASNVVLDKYVDCYERLNEIK